MKKHKPYLLSRAKSGNTYIEATYCKYYYPLPYAALFEEYPAAITRVVLAKKVEDYELNNYGLRLCQLKSNADGTNKVLGYYVPICTVSSEKEATEAVEKSVKGSAAVAELFRGGGA